jgi:hypothetical protein
MDIFISKLNLRAPLLYVLQEGVSQNACDPFDYRKEDGEKIFRFELDESLYREFEPDKNAFLRAPVFCGKRAAEVREGACEGACENADGELPAGNYLFAQKRGTTNRAEVLDMAAEIQQEGLWQKLLLGKNCYLRYLFEDGKEVTQIFREYAEND